MSEMIQWQKRCLQCGRIELCGTSKQRPTGTPTISGKCPNTPSGKHNPIYEKR